MAARPKQYVIHGTKQLSVLAAAARQELVDVLAHMGTVSVAEIAATMGRPADALYFHLRALKRAGLVEQVGYRTRSGRQEALFRTVAPELRLEYELHNAANRRGITAIVSSMLRLGVRDFRRAFAGGDAIVAGSHRELWALRRTGRLSLSQIRDVNRSIGQLMRHLKPQGRGRLYGITVLLTPLDHRSRRSKRNLQSRGDK
jgi:DNA-binding transcriptional ArsR family regulator